MYLYIYLRKQEKKDGIQKSNKASSRKFNKFLLKEQSFKQGFFLEHSEKFKFVVVSYVYKIVLIGVFKNKIAPIN